MKNINHRAAFAFVTTACAVFCGGEVLAATDYRDTLDKAVAGPDEPDAAQGSKFTPYVADDVSYDSNVYRLPTSVTDLSTLAGIGPNAQRSDYMNSATAGIDNHWFLGNRQVIDLDLRVDDNRFKHNDNLNNVSSDDRLVWNWGLGSVLSGQLGADYSRFLSSFVNTDIYSRNIIEKEEYFGAARYQVGPRWAIFGGLLDSKYTLSAPESQVNNSRSKAVDVGAELATNAANTIGFDYRFTDARYPNPIDLNGELFNPDYREDRVRVLAKYVITDKTTIDLSAGYLKRMYSSSTIGNFAGDIWRFTLLWQATEKTQIEVAGWRQLAADLTAQTDYFVDTGGKFAPTWNATEKLAFSLSVSVSDRKYLGSNPGVAITEARHDTITGERASLAYTPTLALTCDFSFGHERRGSNFDQFTYTDNKADASITFKF